MTAIEKYFEAYDREAGRIRGSLYGTYQGRLRKFLTAANSYGPAGTLIANLESQGDYHAWLAEFRDTDENDPVSFPGDAFMELSVKVHLIREFADDPDLILAYAQHLNSINNFDLMVDDVIRHEIMPTIEDLRRYLVDALKAMMDDDAAHEADAEFVPDQSSPGWQELVAAVERVEEAVRGQNDLPPEVRDRRQAEVESGLVLLRAPRFSMRNIQTLLVSCLQFLATNLATTAVGIAATAALVLICEALGMPLPLAL